MKPAVVEVRAPRSALAAVRVLFLSFASAALVLTASSRARAEVDPQAREFFRGKTLTYIVCTTPGGGYDTYGRLVAKHLPKHLPVEQVIVKNVPGAGHLVGANQLYAAEPDGLTIGIFNTGLIYAQLLGQEGIAFDLRRMSYLGKAGGEPRVLVVSTKTDFHTLDDIRRAGRPLLLAASGVGDSGYNDMALLSQALDIPIKHVFGFATVEAQLSMMRGEAEGLFGSYSSNREFVKNGDGRFVFGIDVESVDPSIPEADDLVATKDGKQIVDVVRSQAALLRMTAGPPGIPAERLAVLREAYMASLRDPELLADAAKFDIPILPMDGETLAARVGVALEKPANIVALLASVVGGEKKTVRASGELTAVEDGGKLVRLLVSGAPLDVTISGSRTTVTLDGAPADRSRLTPGMRCQVDYQPDGEREATSIDCVGAN